jgi:UDP-N-acetylmuramoyl-L-alanyl-D-glutamate--2,6-diaminopimelate ligase
MVVEPMVADLIRGLPVRVHCGSADVEITGIVEDSRKATSGCLFVARSGLHMDGRQFIPDAIARGAAVILTDDAQALAGREALAGRLTGLVCENVAEVSAIVIERHFGNPSAQIDLVGITGTNGKTTTAFLVHQLLNGAGVRCGLIGTVQNDDGVAITAANLTTPAAIDLSRMMRTLVDHGGKACVMEASSHALHQHRAAGLQFRVGIFTNLTGDHLDYHQSMDAYFDAKAMLFEALPQRGLAIINADDPAGVRMAKRTRARVLMCSQVDGGADCFASIGRVNINSMNVQFRGPWGQWTMDLPLIGKHNVCNAMQALAACHALGVEPDVLRRGLAQCSAPPGRLEPVTAMHDPYAVLVDYAHTDDALDNVLRSLRPIVARGGKLRVVFGCGGDRDRTKRPRMAAVACALADDVMITSDNPRTEDPQAIIDEICTGVPHDHQCTLQCLADRAEAIAAAVDRIEQGDVLLIAGKGHEDYQIIGTVKRPFDDRKIAAAALASRKAKVGAA